MLVVSYSVLPAYIHHTVDYRSHDGVEQYILLRVHTTLYHSVVLWCTGGAKAHT